MGREVMRNIHPADRLALVRSEIAALEEEEERLRQHLIDCPEDREGSVYVASVGTWSRSKLDMRALMEEVGRDVVERFVARWKSPVVRLKRLPPDAEATSTQHTRGQTVSTSRV